MNVTALKLLDHNTKFCSGLHTVDAVDIPQLMKKLFTNADRNPQFIRAMEAAQRKFKHAKLEIQDDYMHVVAINSLLKSGEYETAVYRVALKQPSSSSLVVNYCTADVGVTLDRKVTLFLFPVELSTSISGSHSATYECLLTLVNLYVTIACLLVSMIE